MTSYLFQNRNYLALGLWPKLKKYYPSLTIAGDMGAYLSGAPYSTSEKGLTDTLAVKFYCEKMNYTNKMFMKCLDC